MAWWLLQHVAVTAALALGVAFVLSLTRFGPVVRHALWLVVLIKFVTPPLIAWPWAVPESLRAVVFGIQPRSLTASAPSPIAVNVSGGHGTEPPDLHAGVVADESGPWSWIVTVWLAGSLALAAIEGVRLRRLARELRTSRPASAELERLVVRASERLGLRPVRVRVIDGRHSPAVWCFGRTQLLWPAALPPCVSAECIDGLIVHELAHVRRRDHWIGWIELIAGVLWWWNPVFWSVRTRLREQAELACDAWVIATLPNGRRAYAESLLALSSASLSNTRSMAVVGVRPIGRLELERRLIMIMQGRAPVRLTRAGALSITLVALATLPGLAAQSPGPAPSAPVPVRLVIPIEANPIQIVREGTVLAQVEPIRPVRAPARVTVREAPAAAVTVEPTSPAATGGQQTRGGSIFGRVTDGSMISVGGVQVTVSSETLVQPMVALTNAAGQFQFPNVPPGRYTVTFDLDGFKRHARMNIIIERGFHAEIDARLEAATEPATVGLPAAVRDLLSQFEAATNEIRREADRQIDARRQTLIGALEALATELTNAGRSDDVAALRELIRRLRNGTGSGG